MPLQSAATKPAKGLRETFSGGRRSRRTRTRTWTWTCSREGLARGERWGGEGVDSDADADAGPAARYPHRRLEKVRCGAVRGPLLCVGLPARPTAPKLIRDQECCCRCSFDPRRKNGHGNEDTCVCRRNALWSNSQRLFDCRRTSSTAVHVGVSWCVSNQRHSCDPHPLDNSKLAGRVQ